MFVQKKTMDLKEQKDAGFALIIGSVLMILTMVLHPVGGNFNHLLRIVTIGIVAHSIAIMSVPFVAYGFWGFTQRLNAAPFLSKIGFSIMFFALIAAMIAAATNGIVLMDFVKSYEDASDATIDSLRPFFVFIRSFNHAFDYIFMVGVCLSILCWSFAIVKTKAMFAWVGYYGILLNVIAAILFLSNYELLHLSGFRMFVFGIVSWILIVGVLLIKNKDQE